MNLATRDDVAVARLLREVLQPATTQAATERVKELAKNPAFTVMLVVQLAQSTEDDIRQLAAVLLRRQLVKSWGHLTVEQQEETKTTLLRRLIEDPSHSARLSIAHAVSSLSRLILAEWRPVLFSFLDQCAASESSSHREAAQYVFGSILDSNNKLLLPHLDAFAQVFLRGLQDPTSPGIRMAAMKGVASLAANADSLEDYQRLRQLIPPLVAVTREACASGNDDVVMFALEIFDDLAEAGDAFRATDLPDLIRFMLTICAEPKLPSGVKEQAFSFIHSITQQKPKVFTKNNLVEEILRVVVPMAFEPDPEDADPDMLTPHRMASQCVDSLALNLPSRLVFESVTRAIGPYISSPNPWERRGALILLGIMSEGCEDIMRNRLNDLLPSVLAAFSSPEPQVLSAVAICWGQLSQFLQPEISKYHESAMGVLLSAIQNSQIEESVKEKVCYAVELFCDNLEVHQIEIHLANLMPTLLHALTTMHGNAARESCIGAIGSVAQAAKEKFIEYAERIYQILEEALGQTADNLITLRSRATACAGSVIQALPKNLFVPYRDRLVARVFEGLETIDHYELREASYRFLGCLAFTLKDDFKMYLEKAMPYAIATLLNSDGIETQYDENDDDPLNGVDSDEDDEDARRMKGFHVRTGFLDEQEAALDFWCCLYRNLSADVMTPWLGKTLQCVDILHKYFHTGIRQTVPALLQAMLLNIHHSFLPSWAPRQSKDSSNPGGKQNPQQQKIVVCSTNENRGWIPGLPAQSQLHHHTFQLWVEKIWPVLCTMITEDDDKEVIGDVFQAIGELLEVLGPHLLEGSTVAGKDVQEILLKACLQVFSCNHVCQRFEDGDIDDDEDSRAIEEYLFEGVSCLVSGLAQCLGQQFQAPFSKLHAKLLRLAKHKKSSAYRCIAIGCYAEVFRTMGPVAAPFIEPILSVVLEGVRQKDDSSLQRNAAYCLGALAEAGRSLPIIQQNVLAFLKALHPIIVEERHDLQGEKLCVCDNAVAAVGRIIRSFEQPQLPLSDLVPMFLEALPLKEDFEESEGIAKTLIHLYMGGCDKEILAQHQLLFLRALVGELANGSISENTLNQGRTLLAAAAQGLGLDNPILTSIAETSPRYREVLNSVLAS